MAESAFIGDGYDLTGVIARAAGIHPRVEITYRPATHDERNQHLKAAADLDKRSVPVADLVARKVSAWDIKDGKGNPVPVSKETAMKLQPVLCDKIENLILGYAGSAEEASDRKNS